MREPPVTVIIPTWNGKERLLCCLEALSRQTYRHFQTIVVINGCKDGTKETLKEKRELQLIINSYNRGFAAAINQGIRASNSPYICTLNDDIFPDPEWLEMLVDAIEREPDVGACSSLMVFAHQPDTVQSAGIAMDRAAIAWDRLRGKPVTVARQPCEVFGASAGAALYRRTMLGQIGLFDERFFAYLEDVDLAWRAQSSGWRCLYVPDAVARHLVSASLGEESPTKKRLKARNKIWTVVKNAPLSDFPLILLYDLMAILYILVKEKDRNPLRGRLEGIRGVRPFLKDRHPGRPRIVEPLVAPWQVPQRWKDYPSRLARSDATYYSQQDGKGKSAGGTVLFTTKDTKYTKGSG